MRENHTTGGSMTATEIKHRMAVWSFNGSSCDCGYGLYDFRFDHVSRTAKAANDWCGLENAKMILHTNQQGAK